MNFINDDEKMRDFFILSKDEFLKSYSYLTEDEYDNTKKIITDKHIKDYNDYQSEKFNNFLHIFKSELEDTNEYIKNFGEEDDISLKEVGEKYSVRLANIMIELGYIGWHFKDLKNLENMKTQMINTLEDDSDLSEEKKKIMIEEISLIDDTQINKNQNIKNIQILDKEIVGGYNDTLVFNLKVQLDDKEPFLITAERESLDMQEPNYKWEITEKNENITPEIKLKIESKLEEDEENRKIENAFKEIENLTKDELLNLLQYYNNYIVEFYEDHEEGMKPVSIYEYFNNEYQDMLEEENPEDEEEDEL